MSEWHTTRPGGRTANVRNAVLDATADLLVESGLENVELSAVAQRAGVGKSTVYRRWGTVTALVADLLVEMANTSSKRPSTGSLEGDLLAIARLIQRTLADPRQGRLFAAIIAAATCNRHTATALADFYDAGSRSSARCRRRHHPRRGPTGNRPGRGHPVPVRAAVLPHAHRQRCAQRRKTPQRPRRPSWPRSQRVFS